MSSNTRRTARARMRVEQERQRRRAERRKRGVIAAVVALLVAAGIAIAVGTASSGGASGPVKVPANASGPGGTVIVYGKPDARNVLDVWEDFRCPFCDKLERTDGATIRQFADNGVYKIRYHMGTFLDDNLGGSGSMNALAAAGAALNEGVGKFVAFHGVLYANQPEETDDAFANTGYLLKLAAKVPGLSTPSFVTAVKNDTYQPWAERVSTAFNKSGIQGTPTLKLNGRTLNVINASGNAITPAQFTALIQQGGVAVTASLAEVREVGTRRETGRALAGLLVVTGALGLAASIALTLEKIRLLENPRYVPSCDINPILSCGSVMRTAQASAFGFPNPILGVAGFSVVVTVGVALLAGASFGRWFWLGLQAGVTFGMAFVGWLMDQTLYHIGALCPYCMVVWAAMIPLFWYVTLHNVPLPAAARRYHWAVPVAGYVIVALLILNRFWYYWHTLL